MSFTSASCTYAFTNILLTALAKPHSMNCWKLFKETGRYRRSPTYTVRCKTKTEAMAAMLAKSAEINSSGTISKTKKPNLLASYCWAFYENRDTERNALRWVLRLSQWKWESRGSIAGRICFLKYGRIPRQEGRMVPTAAQVVESWAEPLLNEVRSSS